MASVELCRLQEVRKALGKSQSELAELLGTSGRAVQSYEQGWRACPPHVQKLAAMLLMLRWSNGRKVRPCFQVNRCSARQRQDCPGSQIGQGQLCWMIDGTLCQNKKARNWQTKVVQCIKCPVTQPWLAS